MNKESACRRTQGFTLLEVMIAVAILAVGLVTLFRLFSGSLRSTKISADYSKAVMGARMKMDEALGYVYLEDYEESMEKQGEFGTGEENSFLEGYRWQVRDEEYIIPDLEEEWSKHNGSLEKKYQLRKITIRVSWKSGENDKSVELVSVKMFYKKENDL
ncbi:MAG: prepilin-type N-terminal cleavage/methylation domain-containing protein [bacterium]